MSWQDAASDATSREFEWRLSMTLDALRDLQAQLLSSCAASSYVYTGVYILCCPPPSVRLWVHNLSTDTFHKNLQKRHPSFNREHVVDTGTVDPNNYLGAGHDCSSEGESEKQARCV